MHTLRAIITIEMEGDVLKEQHWEIESSDPQQNAIIKDRVEVQVAKFMNLCSASLANILAALEAIRPGSAEDTLQHFCTDVRQLTEKVIFAPKNEKSESDPKQN